MNISWEYAGEVDVAAIGRLPLLQIPATAGLYRLSTEGHCYVGQAQNLRHRVYEYCRPTQHLEHEHRMHWLLRGKQCRVEVAVTPEMDSLAHRRSQEALAFEQSRREGFVLWNLSQHPKPSQYRMLIEYHEIMIKKYQSLLEAPGRDQQLVDKSAGL